MIILLIYLCGCMLIWKAYTMIKHINYHHYISQYVAGSSMKNVVGNEATNMLV